MRNIVVKPEITVITPVYNGELYLRQTIESVISQSFANFEYIIINDFSDDSTEKILDEFASLDSRIRVINNNKNCGPLISRNLGLAAAKSRYIAFIDGDDIWPSAKLLDQFNFMNECGISFCYTDFCIFSNQDLSNSRSVIAPHKYYLSSLFSQSGIALSSVMFRADSDNLIKFAECDLYTEGDLYLKLISLYGYGVRLPKELLLYRHHQNSMSGNKIKMFRTIYSFYHERLKFNPMISFLITSTIGLNAVARLIKRYF